MDSREFYLRSLITFAGALLQKATYGASNQDICRQAEELAAELTRQTFQPFDSSQ